MASVWKGALSFGLVNIPSRLYPAVRTGDGDIHFRQLHRKDLAPIKYERISTADGQVVEWKDIVKGYEYRKGKFIALSNEDLKAAALEASSVIEILDFVKEQEIDLRYFETPYYLVPDKGGEKAYALLREAMHSTGMVAIGKFTMRQKQHLASVKASGDALVLEIMRFADELVDPSQFTFPSAEGVRPQERQMAEQLIANLVRPFNASKYTDDYQRNLKHLIEAKLKGEKIDVEEPEATPTKVTDLLARLQESIAQTKSGTRAQPRGSGRSTTAATRAHTRSKTRKTA
jgi:DNA end-binding protein Ku